MGSVALVWFRQDLRLADNPALRCALEHHAAVIPVYIWAPEDEGEWAAGAASRWWLHHSLAALAAALRAGGSQLILRQGGTVEVLAQLVRETHANAVYWNRRYEPAAVAVGTRVKSLLRELGVEAYSCKGALLAEPWDISTATGGNYQVFTPYHRAFLDRIDPAPPKAAPNELSAAKRWPRSLELDALDLRPRFAWDAGLKQTWTPGEAGAHARLHALPPRLPAYRDARDLPAQPGTSRLSPHLHFGEVSPAQVWHAVGGAEQKRGLGRNEWRHGKFLGELIWREFAAQALYHAPTLPAEPFRPQFAQLRWRDAPEDLRAWQQGRTGVDIVDAGMRELWETGWMHNRVRMICASFLVKNLLVPWQRGARWFWDTLVDADLANNSLNWQWIAGSGPDAAPWFRVFNPLLQAKRFDPDGIYQRRWARRREPLLAPFAAEKSRAAALEAYRALKTQDE